MPSQRISSALSTASRSCDRDRRVLSAKVRASSSHGFDEEVERKSTLPSTTRPRCPGPVRGCQGGQAIPDRSPFDSRRAIGSRRALASRGHRDPLSWPSCDDVHVVIISESQRVVVARDPANAESRAHVCGAWAMASPQTGGRSSATTPSTRRRQFGSKAAARSVVDDFRPKVLAPVRASAPVVAPSQRPRLFTTSGVAHWVRFGSSPSRKTAGALTPTIRDSARLRARFAGCATATGWSRSTASKSRSPEKALQVTRSSEARVACSALTRVGKRSRSISTSFELPTDVPDQALQAGGLTNVG